MPSLPAMDALYPELAPYRVHVLPVSHGHVLHLEENGRPDGVAAVVLHGGPGSGSSPLLKRFFDPARYRVISVDQRGAGRSQPRGCTLHNTTAHLIEDLQAVRAHLGIGTWLVVGGSWGATLALAYAAEHPQAVAAMLLRAVFLARPDDIDGFFQHPPREHTAAWSRFADTAPADQRHALLPFLAQALAQAAAQGDSATAHRLALAWWRWEYTLTASANAAAASGARFEPSGAALDALVDRYLVQSHYLVHRCWLDAAPLLERCSSLPQVPTLLLHSRDDTVCRPEAAHALHRCLPLSLLKWVDGAGHDPSHPAMARAMVEALDNYATHGHFS
jgi:proline iminopeptidase